MKASHLTGVRAADALYVPPRGATLQSAVFLQEPVADKAGCGAAYMKFGTGWLGYSGDNNTEGGSTKLQLAMCGLGLEVRLVSHQPYSLANRGPGLHPYRPDNREWGHARLTPRPCRAIYKHLVFRRGWYQQPRP